MPGIAWRDGASFSRIVSDSDLLGGTPVFQGTRVPVQTMFDYLEAGDRLDDFLGEFPSVSREAATEVLEMAKSAMFTNARAASAWNPDDDIRELTAEDFEAAILFRVRQRLVKGHFESGNDIIALRRFVRLTREQFADALGISLKTLDHWEQDRQQPEGPAIALLRIAARRPRVIRENL